MPPTDGHDIDSKVPPFDQFKGVRPLAINRSGHSQSDVSRHRLYTARDPRTRTNVLIKVTSKPGIVYQHSIENEIATLSTINRELPESRHFPFLMSHGRLRDGRVYLVTSLFDELPLAASISPEPAPGRLVAHLMATLEIARALADLHGLEIFHVDLNPMNVLYGSQRHRPSIRIIDFESSYERARHATGVFYNPSTTPGYSAPEVTRQAPDARSDVFSAGAVLYTMLAGFQWTWQGEVDACIREEHDIDAELKTILLSSVDPDPERRYRSVVLFRDALSAYLEEIWPGRSW